METEMAQDYRDLIVWQKAIELTICIYKLTRSHSRKTNFMDSTSQMRQSQCFCGQQYRRRSRKIQSMRSSANSSDWRKVRLFELQTQLRGGKAILELASLDALTKPSR